jgi:ubiquinone/menaquinone biosynthesis C-methylase UbiE
MSQDAYDRQAAAGYDAAFERVSAHFLPVMMDITRLACGHNVLDIATGTGLAAEATLPLIGPSGRVTAADVSAEMVEEARKRLTAAPNASVAVEDGQALSFPDQTFDRVICNLGLMFFPDPQRGLDEFYRVLRPGGRAAISVSTVPERSYNSRVDVAMARHMPALADAASRLFSLGSASRLRDMFGRAGFRAIEMTTVSHRFPVTSFERYFEQFERGWGSVGRRFLALPDDARNAVREEIRHQLQDMGGPIEIEVEFMFGAGGK